MFYGMYHRMYTLCVYMCVSLLRCTCVHMRVVLHFQILTCFFKNTFQPKLRDFCNSLLHVFSKSWNHGCKFVPK
ncbi:hypothetical protein Q9966_003205 [Columba livia]|nr:hypothetical protein Q9966_003205 [Columba livia]